MKVSLFGLPAAGKGSLAQQLMAERGWEQLSTGDMIRRMRQEPGPIGDAMRAVPPGGFASDDLILSAVSEELKDARYAKGAILDGFPRTLAQAQALEPMGVKLDAIIVLNCDEATSLGRALTRRVHLPSGRVYNLLSAPPKKEGFDDVTGDALTHRADDHEKTILSRFADHNRLTVPAIAWLKERALAPVLEIDARQDISVISREVSTFLDNLRSAPRRGARF